MGIFAWIILGLIAGFIAKAIHPGKDPGGFIITAVLGILGGLLGGYLGKLAFGWDVSSFWSIKTWFLAIAGSVILLVLYRLLFRSKASA
ncbi:GlsB/YeaQ/YmgE family stress response membrane protein [Pseudonocardiaceae bacterium YIM PH 21723]|nr:GlsB/YeaQ/YmgE family stress response membrane protein [Pseudonocardiaceae bacterium YIM PH 21723]